MENMCRSCNFSSGQDRYDGTVMSPFTDWSFKYIFGREENKPNLIGFLNLMLMPESPIVDVQYISNESIPVSRKQKGCVFDILCQDVTGDKYLIEMQNSRADNMLERIIFYTCRLIDRMGERGDDWDYAGIKKVYSICLMNYIYELEPRLRRDIQLCDVNEKKPFSDKLNIIMVQMPCANGLDFSKCSAYYEYLLSLLQQMHNGMKTIDKLKQEVAQTQLPEATKELFYQVLETSRVGSLSEEDRLSYESDLKNYRDTMSCIRFARKEGISEGYAEGLIQGKVVTAKAMKAKGLEASFIAECTGLTVAEIEKIQD